MDTLPENAIPIKVAYPLLSAGLFRAHVYPFGVVPKETRKFIKLAGIMKRELNARNRVPYVPKERTLVAVYCTDNEDWYRGYVTRIEHTTKGLVAKVFLIDYGKHLEEIPPHFIQPLPSRYSTNELDSQQLKIALFGVVPLGIHIGLLHGCKLVKQEYWLQSHTHSVSKVLENADRIYFQEVCQREGIHFGYVIISSEDKLDTLQNVLIRSQIAVACDSELEFINKEIPKLIKRYHRTVEVDSEAVVRQRLYPSLPVEPSSRADSQTATDIVDNVGNYTSLLRTSSEDNVSVASKTSSSTSGSGINRSQEQRNDEDEDIFFDASSDSERKAADRNGDVAAFSDVSSECETSVREIENVLDARNDPTLRPPDPDYHVDDVFVLGCDDKNYFRPTSQLADSPLDATTLEMLDRLKVRDLVSCQKYMIPAMLTGKNVTLVDSPKSGKTVAYLMPLISLLRKNRNNHGFGFSPRSVIVCPYSSRCESIHNECWRIIKGQKTVLEDNDQSDLRANFAYGCGSKLEHDKLMELTHGYDVLVCTPRCLLRLLNNKKSMFDLKKMDHIIFDEFHILLESYLKEVNEILEHIGELKNRNLQRVIVSNQWNAKMKKLVEEDVSSRQGFVLMPSYLEAALYVHLFSELKFFSESRKLDDIANLLNQTRGKSVVIVLSEGDDIDHVYAELFTSRRSVFKINNLEYKERDICIRFQEEIEDGLHPVLICTDYTLPHLRLYEADCLIHYSLPHQKSNFDFRFSVLLKRLKEAAMNYLDFGKDPSKAIKKPETYIYINTDNKVQFPLVLDIMKKLHAKVPADIEALVKRVSIQREIENKKDREICIDLRQFGRCVNEKGCDYRHVLTERDQPDPLLPKNGFVQVHITHIYSPTHFRVRLLQHKNEQGKWVEWRTPNPGVLQMKMNSYLQKPGNMKAFEYNDDCKHETVAVDVSSGAGTIFKRAKILKITEYSSRQINEETIEKPRSARVRYIDSGEEAVVNMASIVKLPEDLASVPALTVDMFICNLLPIDEDNTWGLMFRQLIDAKIQECAKEPKNKFIGKIQLVIGSNLWLEPFGCHRHFDSLKEDVLSFSVSRHLLQEKLAVKNEVHLMNLREKCKEAGLVDLVNETEAALDKNKPENASKTENGNGKALGANVPNGATNLSKSNALNGTVNSSKSSASNGTPHPSQNDVLFRKPAPVKSKPASAVKPRVLWRQDNSYIYLTINENIDESYKLSWKDKHITFEGKMGSKIYKFDECLYACIDENVEHRKSGVTIYIKMPKLVKRVTWRRLLKTREPQRWLQLDQNSVISSDESEVEYGSTPDLRQHSSCVTSLPKFPEGFEDVMSSELESDGDDNYFDE